MEKDTLPVLKMFSKIKLVNNTNLNSERNLCFLYICSYLTIQEVGMLEQTSMKIRCDIEHANIWNKKLSLLMNKFQFKFVKETSEYVCVKLGEKCEKWLIKLVLITHNTFKTIFKCSYWEEKYLNPNLRNIYDGDSDSEEPFISRQEGKYAEIIHTEELKISTGDTIFYKDETLFVEDEGSRNLNLEPIVINLTENFLTLYGSWLEDYAKKIDDSFYCSKCNILF